MNATLHDPLRVGKWSGTVAVMSTSTPADEVSENLSILRKTSGLSLRQLAGRLDEIGWPIGADGLNRVEMGKRQVTVGDLVALAMVLGVSPMTLAMPARRQPVQLTPAVRTGWRPAWLWAVGEVPLVVEGGDRVDLFDKRAARYIEVNRPFEDQSLVRELGRAALARLSGQSFTIEIRHDGGGKVEGTVTITGGDDG
jgi:transcriptional regulator with XRE-family HTH domain